MYANELWPMGLRVKVGSSYGTEDHPFRGVFGKNVVLTTDQRRDPWHMNIQRIHDHEFSFLRK
jgi:hypothetical protein